jgi:hypothetical protein
MLKRSTKKLENKGSVDATEKRIKEFLGNREHNLTAEVIRDLADAIAYKEMGDKMKIQYLVSKFEVKLDKKILDDVFLFEGNSCTQVWIKKWRHGRTMKISLAFLKELCLQCWGGRDIHISISCLVTA